MKKKTVISQGFYKQNLAIKRDELNESVFKTSISLENGVILPFMWQS
jgi:hypothetical protein